MINDLVSIIVPVYNCDKYLDKCLSSIANQTHRNIEIIVVDDGSTDRSGSIADKWGDNDKRITVVHQENGGQSAARNVGLDISKGEYLAFVDSDDYIDVDMMQSLITILQENECEIVACGMRKVYTDSNCECAVISQPNVRVYSNFDAMEELINDDIVTSHACNKLFRSRVFNPTRFPEGEVYEDIAIMHEVFSRAKKVAISSSIKYNYFIHCESTSFRTDTARDIGLFNAFSRRLDFILKSGTYSALDQKCYANVVRQGIGAIYRLSSFKKVGYKEAIETVRRKLKSIQAETLHNCYLSTEQKCKAFAIVHMWSIYRVLIKVYGVLHR